MENKFLLITITFMLFMPQILAQEQDYLIQLYPGMGDILLLVAYTKI